MPRLRDDFKLSSEDEQEDVEEQASDEQGSEQQNDSDDSGSSDDSVERPSPSLYRKELADAQHSQDDQSSPVVSDSEEEQIDEDELELHSISNLSSTPGAANQDMAAQFAELSRMFASVREQNRKLRLATLRMSLRTARQSLDFALPIRKRTRTGNLVPATPQDAYVERNSLRLQNQRSTRMRLQQKFEVIAELATEDSESDRVKEWVRKHAIQVMAPQTTSIQRTPHSSASSAHR
jgi:hypothetical protein